MMSRVRLLLVLVFLGAREAWAQALGRPLCPPDDSSKCQSLRSYNLQYSYKVEGQTLKIEYIDGSEFSLHCIGKVSLDSRALPRFEFTLRVRVVKFIGCVPPAVSYGAVLTALNVNTSSNPELYLNKMPAAPPLRATHFAGLHNLVALKIYGLRTKPHKPAPDFLSEMRVLRSLRVYAIRVTPEVLEWLPASLVLLELIDTGVERVEGTVLRRLLRLEELLIRENHFTEVEAYAAPMLRNFHFDAPNATVTSKELPSTFEILTLKQSQEKKPWVKCDALNALSIVSPKTETLPARWVASCANLTNLVVMRAIKLVHLSEKLLEDAWRLRSLVITWTSLEKLPPGLLTYATNLSHVDFSDNKLQTLPRDFFSTLSSLHTLKLDGNQFSTDVLYRLQSVTSLQTLSLAGNKNVSHVCSSNKYTSSGRSPLWQLTKLTSLWMGYTGISSVCSDWRNEMPYLQQLDLTYTKITFLTYNDLQYVRAIPDASVNLTGANVTRVDYTYYDYLAALDPTRPRSQATVALDSTLTCDCNLYWTARAMQEKPEHAPVRGLRCFGNELNSLRLDDLVCAAPKQCAQLPACRCTWREDETAGALSKLLTVNCEQAGYDHMPNLFPVKYPWRLLLANNSIRELHAADLPHEMHNLRELDLSNNGLQRVDGDVVETLIAIPGLKVRLAGNSFDCNCTVEPLRIAVRTYPNVFNLTARCKNGSTLISLDPHQCSDPGTSIGSMLAMTLSAGLVVIVVTALSLGLCLSRPACRVWLKAILHRWGWLSPEAESDDGRRFDAFVSFSHHDAKIVSKLVARLEGGRPPYRLCLHDRDWAPGEWIPAQIAASVRASRRTIAVVSRHFLRSKWARAEFREAHAHAVCSATPRLVVVLLEPPDLLPLDRELRAYVRRNTYVQWGDRWFWDKLLLSMPPPRIINPPAPDPATESSKPLLTDPISRARISATASHCHLYPGPVFSPNIGTSKV